MRLRGIAGRLAIRHLLIAALASCAVVWVCLAALADQHDLHVDRARKIVAESALFAQFERSAREIYDESRRTGLVHGAAVSALFLAAGTAVVLGQGRSLARRTRQLSERVELLARGERISASINPPSDELGNLARSVDLLSGNMVRAIEHAAERSTREREFQVASKVQQQVLPTSDSYAQGVLEVAGYLKPSASCVADIWSYHSLGDKHTLVLIGAVSGSGISSALVCAAAKAACDAARVAHGADVTVSRLLEAMNAAVFQQAQRRLMMTCFVSIIDTEARLVTYANAGHSFPLVYRTSEGRGEFLPLTSRGNQLGQLSESRYSPADTALVPGDVLLWHTPGILAHENEAGEPFGDKRLRASVRRAAELGAPALRDKIVEDVLAFARPDAAKDDMTLVVGTIS